MLYLYQSIPFLMHMKKNLFSRLFHVQFPRYFRFRCFFWKNYYCVTFVLFIITGHVTYHWKALNEQSSNIYTFMSQKPFIFHIYSLIIFALLLKNCVNSLLDEYYQKLFLGFTISYTYQLIPSLTYIKKNIFSRFFLFGLLHIYWPFKRFFLQKIFITNFCYRQLCVSCDISFETSRGVHFENIQFY